MARHTKIVVADGDDRSRCAIARRCGFMPQQCVLNTAADVFSRRARVVEPVDVPLHHLVNGHVPAAAEMLGKRKRELNIFGLGRIIRAKMDSCVALLSSSAEALEIGIADVAQAVQPGMATR